MLVFIIALTVSAQAARPAFFLLLCILSSDGETHSLLSESRDVLGRFALPALRIVTGMLRAAAARLALKEAPSVKIREVNKLPLFVFRVRCWETTVLVG